MNTRKVLPAIMLLFSPFMSCQADEATDIVFRKSEQVLEDTRTFRPVIADVDLDGDNDIFITNYVGPCRLWLNDGKGVFAPSPQMFDISEVHDAAIGDFNGDTYPDIFMLSHAGPNKVFLNNGSGGFTMSEQDIGLESDGGFSITFGDVNGDRDTDVFILYGPLPNRLWLNNGKAVFTLTDTNYGGSNGNDMALADVNGDTFLDLFICFTRQPDEIWMNDGSGSFINSGQRLGSESGHERVESGDVDDDGDIDFVVANSEVGVKIWLNQNNTGRFVEAGPYFEVGATRGELFDADLDGDLDLITAHSENGNKLWVNNGTASFTALGELFGGGRVLGIACGRLDEDDYFDVVLGMADGSGGNPIYFNEAVSLNRNK